MLSPDTQNLLARILLALAEGERSVEDARKEISNEDSYDIQAIFKVLDNNGDNYITPKDIQKYLNDKGLEVNFTEVKLLILFYDQDHDFSLTYGEIFKIIHPGKEFPRIPKYKNDESLNVKVDRKLYNLLEKEIIMARIVLALLDEIKHKRDFNIHSAFHALKYYACITGDSINLFLKSCGMKPTAGDVRAIVKRLDINKDEIIDFCEFHAFLGFPDCTFCCPCFPCGKCGAQYCPECLQDIPCYLLGCDHKGMDSKMRCTSFEHNPGTGGVSSLLGSIRPNYSPRSMEGTKFSRKAEEEENEEREKEKQDFYSRTKGFKGIGKKDMLFDKLHHYEEDNIPNGQFFTPGGYGYNKGNISPEQFKLLQGLTNPEQLNKFMTISGILDRQNSGEINLTANLSLRLSPIRDFDPKEWGCKNCPCNIHSNPNVPCDCCRCNVCPFKSNENTTTDKKQKLRLFPKMSLYSYSYSYEPDINSSSQSLLSTTYGPNSSIYVNSPKKRNVYFDKETNQYKMISSSDDEQEYNDYMNKIVNIKDNFDLINDKKMKINNDKIGDNVPNSMIYSDEIANQKPPNINYNDNDEEYNQNNIMDNEENVEEEEDIRKRKVLINKMYNEEEDIINKNIKNKKKRKKRKQKGQYGNEDEEEDENDDGNEDEKGDEDEDEGNQQPDQDQYTNQRQGQGQREGQGQRQREGQGQGQRQREGPGQREGQGQRQGQGPDNNIINNNKIMGKDDFNKTYPNMGRPNSDNIDNNGPNIDNDNLWKTSPQNLFNGGNNNLDDNKNNFPDNNYNPNYTNDPNNP